jgi:hypothetical protein
MTSVFDLPHSTLCLYIIMNSPNTVRLVDRLIGQVPRDPVYQT